MRDDDMPSGEFNDFAGLAGLDIFGEYGVTSNELPAVSAQQRARWEQEAQAQRQREQRARAKTAANIDRLRRHGVLSAAAYDWLQDELAAGYLPDVFRDEFGHRRVRSGAAQRTYSLAGFEHMVQESLPIGHPDRATQVQLHSAPPMPQWQAPHVQQPLPTPPGLPWHPAYNTRLTPPPQMRQRLPPGMAGFGAGFGAPAPATRPILQENNEKRGLC